MSQPTTNTKTPLYDIIRLHYALHDQEAGPWTLKRYNQLCIMLRLTQDELSALVRVQPSTMNRALRTGRVPAAIRLLLDLVERTAHSKFLGKEYTKPLFPEL